MTLQNIIIIIIVLFGRLLVIDSAQNYDAEINQLQNSLTDSYLKKCRFTPVNCTLIFVHHRNT